jgi:MFS transporter, ACS family, D-galactonate transporter
VLANFVGDINLVITIMSIAFFGQGMSAISWTLVSDIAPKELLGLAGGVFNFFANLGSIVTPLAIGFILAATNSFNGGLVFISAVALVGALSYIFIVGKVFRFELTPTGTLLTRVKQSCREREHARAQANEAAVVWQEGGAAMTSRSNSA